MTDDRSHLSKAEDRAVPVYVPNALGQPILDVARGDLDDGKLVIQFSSSLAAVAVQRIFERGNLLGLQFIMLKGDQPQDIQTEDKE